MNMSTFFVYLENIWSKTHNENCCSAGLPVEAAQQGHLQASANELFSPDVSLSDSEHHHVQAGQETQRSVWSTAGKEDGVIL